MVPTNFAPASAIAFTVRSRIAGFDEIPGTMRSAMIDTPASTSSQVTGMETVAPGLAPMSALPSGEPGVTAAVSKAIQVAEELGAEVGEARLPRSVDFGLACYYLVAPAEASSNLARYDGVRYGFRAAGDGDLTALYARTRWEGFGPEPRRRILIGTYALSAGYYEAFYGQAQKVRTLIVREHAAVFERFDVIATPTSPTVAFELGHKAADPLAMYACDLLTIPSCMAGLPGLNVPVGLMGESQGGWIAPLAASAASQAYHFINEVSRVLRMPRFLSSAALA